LAAVQIYSAFNSRRHAVPNPQKAESGVTAMTMFAVLGVIFLGLFIAPMFGHDRPVARW
jgi:hypothetical protein